ncbi:hypothetical protein GC065_04070, partial [Neisseria meningitidis]|nr:hypothetical protein [Neisseria meningitidis]
ILLFSLCIVSPKWISHHVIKKVFWSNALILEQFDHKIIKSEIDKILEYCSKETWDLTLSNLLRFFSWEFEDYNPNT